jgi:putative integral membrane protein (TIGR02587 family)
MTTSSRAEPAPASPDRVFGTGLARAFGGAIIFGLPILMTMEMWQIGAAMPPLRLILLLLLSLPLLVGLSALAGFERTVDFKNDVLDAFVAIAVGVIASTAILFLLAVLRPGHSLAEIVGRVGLQAVPASIGALLAQDQLGGHDEEEERRREEAGYGGEIFLMAVGALFLAFNIAPTDEIVLIAARMTSWHSLAMIAASLVVMHAFVYAVEFHGQAHVPEGTPWWSVFLRYTVVGYVAVLLMSAYILWTFGRLDGVTGGELVSFVLVLGFPASVGAAAARLIP